MTGANNPSLVDQFLRELWAFDAWAEQAGRAAVSTREISPTYAALRAARLGVLGDGCGGSAGSGRADDPASRLDRAIDRTRGLPREPVGADRYRSLSAAHRHLADWLCSTREEVREIVCGARKVGELTWAQWTGLHHGTPAQQLEWHRKIATGDKTPALRAAGMRGDAILEALAEAWFQGGA